MLSAAGFDLGLEHIQRTADARPRFARQNHVVDKTQPRRDKRVAELFAVFVHQLAGKRAAVQASTTAEKALLCRENPNVPEMKQVLCFSTLGEAAAALRKNYVDMVVAHEYAVSSLVDTLPDLYREIPQTLYANELGVAFEKGTHEALAARLQTAIDAMREDGTAEAIVEKYGFDAEKSLGGGN